jgi:hypothetical protein
VPENNDKNSDNMDFIQDDDSNVEKVWVIDWNGKFEKASSAERTNYLDALKLFNEKTQEGKNTVLYEVQKSIPDGKMLKRVPILNSSKYTERKKNLPLAEKEQAIKKEVFSSRKSRFIILLGIIISFIVAIYFINVLASDGVASSHHVILEMMVDNPVRTLMIVLYY